jgi:hypothetical protein
VTAHDRDGRPVQVGPIREHVPGAPRQPGELVVVLRLAPEDEHTKAARAALAAEQPAAPAGASA